MPGTLAHSPAEILHAVLVNNNIAVDPEVSPTGLWPMFIDEEPDSPDDLIAIYNTLGVLSGRTMPDSEMQDHNGIMFRVRSLIKNDGYTKAKQIALFLDTATTMIGVSIDSATYRIDTVNRISDIGRLGRERESKRFLFTINALMLVRQRT